MPAKLTRLGAELQVPVERQRDIAAMLAHL
jgi:hypothetical protein